LALLNRPGYHVAWFFVPHHSQLHCDVGVNLDVASTKAVHQDLSPLWLRLTDGWWSTQKLAVTIPMTTKAVPSQREKPE
jgi:hypothetical protein